MAGIDPKERETHINFDKYGDKVVYYTNITAHHTQIEERLPEEAFISKRVVSKDSNGNPNSWQYTIHDEFFRGPRYAFYTGKTAQRKAEEFQNKS